MLSEVKDYKCFPFAPEPVLPPCMIEGKNERSNKRGRKKGEEQRVKYVVRLPLIWLLSILPSCILPMMETYKTITTGITKADRSTGYWHIDNAHRENQNHKQGDRKMTFDRNSLTVTSQYLSRVI